MSTATLPRVSYKMGHITYSWDLSPKLQSMAPLALAEYLLSNVGLNQVLHVTTFSKTIRDALKPTTTN